MSEHYLDSLLPDFGEYSLESVLDSYRKRETAPAPAPAETVDPAQSVKAAEAIAQRSRQIVMEALGETLNQHRKIPELQFDLEDLPAPPEKAAGWSEPAGDMDPPDTEAETKRRVHISPDGVITVDLDIPQVTEEQPPEEDVLPVQEDDAFPEEPPEEPAAEESVRTRRASRPPVEAPKKTARDTVLAPMVRFFATMAARRQMQKAEASNWPDPVDIQETDELSPQKANKFYAQQLRPLRFRFRVCVFLCVILAWISFRLPMAGLLGRSNAVQSGVSLLLLMTVMMASLDILAAGARQLFDLRPGAEALAMLASVMSCVDAVMVMAGYGETLPFCAVGAFSLTAALWGEKLDCTARARTMRMAAISKTPSALTAQETNRGGHYLARTQRSMDGIVRRNEQPDFCQSVYATAAPLLLLASFLLAVGASMDGQGAYFLHTLSALLSVSASFTAFLSFPLPYSMAARKLQPSGAAIIGYAGCAEIGKTKRVVISDADLFPPGTMKLSGINILEGADVKKVVSCTASLLAASGSGAANVFMELMDRRKYSMVEVDEFRCHEGGGLSARVNDEQVLVGSAGFMNLMGIRLPQNMAVKNAICTALSGELVGVFTVDYVPVTSVQDALVTLLQGRTQPVFAIRDFNITPLMIRQLFRMPTDNFNFPPFRDRYRISAGTGSNCPVSAVLGRTGMGPLVDAAEAGRKLYSTCRIGTIISLAGTAVGLVIMFLLCRAGSFDTATAGNVLSYMLLWALPVAIMAFGQSR